MEETNPGLAQVFDHWCRKEGLISYRNLFKELPDASVNASADLVENLLARLDAAEPGLYGWLGHPEQLAPALQQREMLIEKRSQTQECSLTSAKMESYRFAMTKRLRCSANNGT